MSLIPLSTLKALLAKHCRLNHIRATSTLFSNPRWDAQLQLLTLDFAISPDQVATVILTSWERGVEVFLLLNDEWEINDNPFAASLFPIEFFDEPLLQDWVLTIPVDVLDYLQCFAINPIGFLRIICQDDAACELFLDHPVLFTLLYQQTKKRQQGLPWFLLHCRMKRRRILKYCGLPATPSAVKLLQKLKFKRFNQRHSDLITQVFLLDYAVLNHLDTVAESLLRVVVQHPMVLKSRLLRHWQEQDAPVLMSTLNDVYRMRRHRFLSPRRIFEPIKHCRNLADVQRFHDRLVEVINRHLPEDEYEQAIFPEPPLTGTATIIPLTTYADLRLEGQSQQHCVISYAEEILNGSYYVYRVLAPERATLGVKLVYHGKYPHIVLEQLKGQCNAPVSEQTQQVIENWVLSHYHTGEGHD